MSITDNIVYLSRKATRVHLVDQVSLFTMSGGPGMVKTMCGRTSTTATLAGLRDWETWPCKQCREVLP